MGSVKTLVAAITLGSLLIGACSPAVSTPTPTPTPRPSSTPVASASPVVTASASPSASQAPAFDVNPPVQYLDPKTIYATTFTTLVRSDDAGTTWTDLGAPQFARFDELRMIDRERGWSVLFFRRDQPQIGCQQASNAAPCHSAVGVTSDGGRTWTVRLTSPLNAGGGATIDHLQAVDASHAWVFVTTGCDNTGCTKELRATSDGGLTWKAQRVGLLVQLRVASLARAWVSADTDRGGSLVHGTADGGATWRQQLATAQPVIGLDAASERDAWALTRDGAYCTSSTCQRYELLVTRDGGGTWSSLANPKDNVIAGTPASCVFGHFDSPLFASPQIGWLGLSRGAGGAAGSGGMMRTDDGGRTWTCSALPPDVDRMSAADPTNVLALSRDPQTAAYALRLSRDGGRSWTRILAR